MCGSLKAHSLHLCMIVYHNMLMYENYCALSVERRELLTAYLLHTKLAAERLLECNALPHYINATCTRNMTVHTVYT